jgi:integral membrane protein
MALQPTPEALGRIRKNLKFFEISAAITGVMLFGLYIVAGIRWGMDADIWLFTEHGFAQLVQLAPDGVELDYSPASGFNFTTVFLIIHGWFYVIYLIAAFSLWSPMRWPFWRFLVIAIAGTLIIVSFIVEVWTVNETKRQLAQLSQESEDSHGVDAAQNDTSA